LPGDTVEIKNKATYVNGERVDEPWTVHRDNWNIGFPRDTYGPVTVPPESFFVMGDNRDASEDSRYWGFVPAENLIGEAFLIYWPPWRIRLLRNPWQDQAE